MIVSSTYTEGPPQVDGRRYVSELHTDDRGQTYTYEWLGDQDAAMVLADRSAVLSAQIAAQRAAEAVVLGTAMPLTKYQFRQLFTFSERVAVDELEASLEQHPGLAVEQRAIIRTGFRDFNAAQDVARPFLQPVLDMLDLFVSLGILTPERKAQIVSAGNG